MRIFISLIFIFLLVVTLILLISKNPFIKIDESFSKNEITESENKQKLLDLTSLSERVSKKNIYLDLERISKDDFTYQLTNLSAFKKVINLYNFTSDFLPLKDLSIFKFILCHIPIFFCTKISKEIFLQGPFFFQVQYLSVLKNFYF